MFETKRKIIKINVKKVEIYVKIPEMQFGQLARVLL